MASLKRKRVSKRNKSSWRKHVDVTDVENFLEEQRLEERLGQSLGEKKDEDLFIVDSIGDSTNVVVQKTPASEKPFRKSLRVKEVSTPKCYSILERRSAVQDPIIKRNYTKPKAKIPNPQNNAVQNVAKKKTEMEFRDIWGEKDTTRELNGLTEWLTPDTIRNVLHGTGRNSRKIPRSLLAKPSPIAAIEAPHPGTSYNPSLADHRTLLQAVADVEAAEQKKEAHLRRVTSKMFRKVPVEVAEQTWRNEMLVGLVPSSDSEMEAGNYSTVNPPVQRKKKTLQKRRKLREERERRQQLKEERVEKKKRADVNERLLKLEKQITKREKLNSEDLTRKKAKIEDKKSETKVLGRNKFEQPLLEFQSPSELKGSLRKLAPEGSLLMDRFKSLQKRNVIEPTLKRKIRIGKVKRFVKREHRDE